MDWLLTQAQTASPLFAVGCLVGMGVLWRQHVKDSQTIITIGKANADAMSAVVRAIERGSATTAVAIAKLAGKLDGKNGQRR